MRHLLIVVILMSGISPAFAQLVPLPTTPPPEQAPTAAARKQVEERREHLYHLLNHSY